MTEDDYGMFPVGAAFITVERSTFQGIVNVNVENQEMSSDDLVEMARELLILAAKVKGND